MAAIAVAVIGGINVTAPETVSAQEAVAQAAQQSGPVKSGKVAVTVETDGMTFTSEYAFDGGSFDATFGSAPAPEGEGSGRIIRIAGKEYSSFDFLTSSGEFIESPVGMFSDDVDYASILSLDSGDALDLARLLPVIEAAEDLSEVESQETGTTYQGTVRAEIIESLDRTQLPAGFAAVLRTNSEPGPPEYGPAGYIKPNQLGDTVVFELLLQDEALSSVTLEIPDYRLTIRYSDLGQPQNLSVPASTITPNEAEELFASLDD